MFDNCECPERPHRSMLSISESKEIINRKLNEVLQDEMRTDPFFQVMLPMWRRYTGIDRVSGDLIPEPESVSNIPLRDFPHADRMHSDHSYFYRSYDFFHPPGRRSGKTIAMSYALTNVVFTNEDFFVGKCEHDGIPSVDLMFNLDAHGLGLFLSIPRASDKERVFQPTSPVSKEVWLANVRDLGKTTTPFVFDSWVETPKKNFLTIKRQIPSILDPEDPWPRSFPDVGMVTQYDHLRSSTSLQTFY